jgi:integrase
MTHAVHAAALQAHPLDDVHVLHGRPLRGGFALDETARFRDDVWPLGPAIQQRQQTAMQLNFASLPANYRTVAKELCYALLSADLPPGEQRPALRTVHSVLRDLAVFLAWLHQHTPAAGGLHSPSIGLLTGADLIAYQRHLLTRVGAPSRRTTRRAAVRLLWRYRTILGTDRLSFDPLRVEGWSQPAQSRRENATARIPEQVHGPLLAWALRLVDDFAGDILTADQHWTAVRATRHTTNERGAALQAVRRLLDDHIATGRPLPGRRGKVNVSALAEAAGCARNAVVRSQQRIAAAVAQVGITDYTRLDVPITALLDGRPWLDGIATEHHRDDSRARLARMLQAACYVVIAFLSGMRDSEIKHLRRGCLRTIRDSDGRAYRYRVTSRAFKGERDPAGVEATWVVGEPAARAIRVLEQLQPPDAELLFQALPHQPGQHNSPTFTPTNIALSHGATSTQLNELIGWINRYCTAHHRSDGIPKVNNRDWKLSTSQFRRTLAWFIARRPGGVIAGAIAYRHLGVQMFEGYAGTSDSGFRAEVESEQALARGEHLLAMIDAHDHQQLAGPAADEASRRLDEFGQRANFAGTIITDEQRLKRLMRRDDPVVYPGRYVTCVYNHTTALCRKRHDSRGRTIPDPADCQPFTCHNVALTADNLAAWHDELRHLDAQLADRPALPPLLHHQLTQRRDHIRDLLNNCRTEGPS